MQPLSLSDVRRKYLDFFASKGHVIIPSARLVPENDPTTLFTGSGMQPMISYLLGQKHPNGTKITDSQKCLRVQDIDDIGDNRHTTFFEMLGNWSLGDYFKAEQIPWMFEFLTDKKTGLGLDPARIYVTIFEGNTEIGIPKDTESAELWKKEFASKEIEAKLVDDSETNGMQGGRIFSYNEKKNWWSRAGVPSNMPAGEPGGPDTEMFWDFSKDEKHAQLIHASSEFKDQPCHVNCDCGRFMEIGNNVFMQYIKTEKGFEQLPQRNVDFGGGLERLTAAVLDSPDVFKIDIFEPIITTLEKISGKTYTGTDIQYFRIIADHIRAATFLIGDDVLPDKKDQGYFARRLIRRAFRFGRYLGINEPFLFELATSVIASYSSAYPNLQEKEDIIVSEIKKEEEKFSKTLKTGLLKFEQIFQNRNDINGQQAFELYSTYGFPIEMIIEEAQKSEKTVDVVGFQKEFNTNMKAHQDLSRTASAGKFKGGLADHSEMSVKYHTATHLLHKALKMVLGEHVQQKGSNITPERLRFDFSHPDKMTPEQIKQTEDVVNQQIQRDLVVTREEMSVAEAKEKNALGLFEHKYGDVVSVYTVGDFSCEICGGPHVEHTGTLGTFKITKEEASSAGVRRIKAILE
jgi:alanyl-tRNA synthetase